MLISSPIMKCHSKHKQCNRFFIQFRTVLYLKQCQYNRAIQVYYTHVIFGFELCTWGGIIICSNPKETYISVKQSWLILQNIRSFQLQGTLYMLVHMTHSHTTVYNKYIIVNKYKCGQVVMYICVQVYTYQCTNFGVEWPCIQTKRRIILTEMWNFEGGLHVE